MIDLQGGRHYSKLESSRKAIIKEVKFEPEIHEWIEYGQWR